LFQFVVESELVLLHELKYRGGREALRDAGDAYIVVGAEGCIAGDIGYAEDLQPALPVSPHLGDARQPALARG
jgi:hypothetical protein